MSIDRIYREFFGFSLIIFSLFLFGSLITFSYLDTIEDLLIVDKEFKNKSKVSVDVSRLTGQFVFLISLDGVEQKKTSIIIQ